MAFNFSSSQGSASPTAFEQQREELVREIAVKETNEKKGMEEVLQNINQLNRNLESAIAVGNEFGSVEALWSQFEHFMGRSVDGQGQNPDQNPDQDQDQGQSQGEGEGQEHDQGQDDDKDQSQVKEEE